MLTYFCDLFAVPAFALVGVSLRGGIRLARAVRSGEKARAKALAWAALRIGLTSASLACVVMSQGRSLHDIKMASVLMIIVSLTRFPSDARTLGWLK